MRRPLFCALASLALVVMACTSAPPEPASSEGPSSDVTKARNRLGGPLVAVAEAAAVLSDDMDTVRHDLERGQAMRDGLDVLETDVAQLRQVANDLLAATRITPHAEAADVAKMSVADALAAADAGAAEAAFLRNVARIDARLLKVAARWNKPGSQSEQRERLSAEDAVIASIAREVRALGAQPRSCPALVDNRARWAEVVRTRTRRLAEHANSFSGERYDELRDEYRDEPFGEDALQADAADRSCWLDSSDVATTPDDLRKRVEQVEQLLSLVPGVRA